MLSFQKCDVMDCECRDKICCCKKAMDGKGIVIRILPEDLKNMISLDEYGEELSSEVQDEIVKRMMEYLKEGIDDYVEEKLKDEIGEV